MLSTGNHPHYKTISFGKVDRSPASIARIILNMYHDNWGPGTFSDYHRNCTTFTRAALEKYVTLNVYVK